MENTFLSSSSSTTTTLAAASTAALATTTNNTSNSNNTSSICSSSSSTAPTTTATSHVQNSLKALNKSSYKISKPLPRNPNPIPTPPPPPANVSSGSSQQQSQPPVYNIDKSDFRDVVQKLTGSPAHRPTTAKPPPPPNPPAQAPNRSPPSRLHRIRPPPLAHLSPRPPPPQMGPAIGGGGDGWVRPPLSPLPPLPTVSAAAESPISAYMRRLHSGQPFPAPSPPGAAPPLSPLGFGCVPSPRTAAAYQSMLSPSLLFPTSPRLPMPSPRWGEP